MKVNNRFWCLTALDNDFIIKPLMLSVVHYISTIFSLQVAFNNINMCTKMNIKHNVLKIFIIWFK